MTVKRVLTLAILLLAVFTLSGCALIDDISTYNDSDTPTLEDKMMDTRTLMRRANVGVNVEYRSGGSWIPGTGSRGESQGSGVVFAKTDSHYYALTNFHVIDPRDFDEVNVTIVPSMEEVEIDAAVIASDSERDLALLRFALGDLDLGVLDINMDRYESLERKDMLLAVGNPSAVNSIVTFGQYHGMVNTDDVDFEVIYHSALIYPGNSGGALVDLDGYLMGINTWGVSGEPERNLAVPLPEIIAFLEEEGVETDPGEPDGETGETMRHSHYIHFSFSAASNWYLKG